MAALSAAESNRASIRYIKEAVWGTTPASGTAREYRLTGSSLAASKNTKTSDELRADRMVPSIVEVAAKSAGDIKWELSAYTHDDMFQAFLLGAWTRPQFGILVRGTTVSVSGTHAITLSGTDYRNWLSAGMVVKLEGFTHPENNGYFTISGSPAYSGGNTVITVSETLVVEAGTAATKLLDADDVISHATDTTLDSGNTVTISGSFRATPVVGQRVWIEGLGKETGTVQAAATDPAEGDTITVSDGVDTVVFEVRTDLALVDQNHVGVALSGTPGTMAANLAAAIMAQFVAEELRVSATVSTDTVTLTNHRLDGGSIATSDASAFTVTDFSGGDLTKGGFFTVASVPNSTSFTTTETLGTDTNSGSRRVIVKGSHLRNPGDLAYITKQSFSIETGFTDVAKYFYQRGMRVGSFDMNVASGAIVNGMFGFSGRDTTNGVVSVLGNTSTYSVLPTTATEVLNATANVGAVLKNGAALSTAIKSLSMKGDAKLRDQDAVGSKFPAGVAYGRFTLTGKIEAYFNDLSFYNNFINHDTVSIAFTFEDRDHVFYQFTIPAAKIKSDPVAPGKIDEDVMESLDFEAQRDAVLNTQFMIDRFSSVYPASVAA